MGTGRSGMKARMGREDGGMEAAGAQECRREEAERRPGWGQQGAEGWKDCGDAVRDSPAKDAGRGGQQPPAALTSTSSP